MLQKLIVDRYLTLPAFDQSAPAASPGMPADFSLVPNRLYNIQESSISIIKPGQRQETNILQKLSMPLKTSQVTTGAHATKAHRTFRWLPWLCGKVSCVPLAGADILTGRMSGCWLVIFQYNGQQYAGHIGTELTPTTPNSVQAKAAWRNAVNAGHITPVAAFNPVGPGLPAQAALNLKGEAPEFFGAFESTGTVYTAVLTIPGAGGTERRIARVVRMATTPDVTDF